MTHANYDVIIKNCVHVQFTLLFKVLKMDTNVKVLDIHVKV